MKRFLNIIAFTATALLGGMWLMGHRPDDWYFALLMVFYGIDRIVEALYNE